MGITTKERGYYQKKEVRKGNVPEGNGGWSEGVVEEDKTIRRKETSRLGCLTG